MSSNIIYKKLKKLKFKITVMPVVLIVAASFLNIFLAREKVPYLGDLTSFNDLGGPANAVQNSELLANALLAINGPVEDFSIASNDADAVGFMVVESSALLNAANPLSDALPTRDGLMIYKVQPGDTLSKIAASFEISLNTIFWANPKLRDSLITPGEEVVVLPISGVVHVVQGGDTLESIASLYNVAVEKILKYNPRASLGNLQENVNLIIPDAKPKKIFAISPAQNLPDLSGYFSIPVKGWNWGRLHPINAVDIANACGTPIYAAAEGLVIDEKSTGWNSGYGHYLDIEHPIGATTRYSHTQRNVVAVGDYVLKGDLVAYIGNTGNVHGPTGCHLHFEVRGARNPFVK